MKLPTSAGRVSAFRKFLSSCAFHPHTKRLLIVYHSRTGLADQMSDALETGARNAAKEMEIPFNEFQVVKMRAAKASHEDLLAADGFLFCAPENLASTSGEMLEFFHRNYYQCFEVEAGNNTQEYTEMSKLLGKPFGIAVAAGSDGRNAAAQMARICQGWRLKKTSEPVIVKNGLVQTKQSILMRKKCPQDGIDKCLQLGGLLAATILL